MVRLTALLLAITALSACGIVDRPTRGENGVATFAYNEGLLGCIFGCDADEPLALDGNATVMVINGDDLGAFHVSSDDPEVLEVIEVPGDDDGWPSARVRGLSAGAAGLVVVDASSGEVIDVLVMEVHEVERIEVSSPEILQTLTLTPNRELSLSIDLLDADDERLAGVGAVTYALDGLEPEPQAPSLELIVAEVITEVLVGTTRESVRVAASETLQSGTVVMTATSGAQRSLPFAVVDPGVVDTVELEIVGPVEVGEMVTVEARGYTASGERVYEPVCDWTIDGGDTEAVEIGRGDAFLSFEPAHHGKAEVQCASQGAQSAITVRVPRW